MPIKPYDTERLIRNASCVPFRGRGPRSGEGVDGGKNDYDILILCLIALKGKRLTTFCASLRSGGRRLAVRTAMEHPIGALPRTPFPASRDFPSRGNERYEGKNSESYTLGTISAFSPFGGWRHHLARWEACHMTLKVNPVTLTLYSSPCGRYHNPRPEGPSNLRTLRPSGRSIL